MKLIVKDCLKEIEIEITETKKGNLVVKYADDNRKLDKCALSFFFPAYSYYSIYWDSANKNEMIKALINIYTK